MNKRMEFNLNQASGFSMIEVMVTLAILLIGLLGLAGMMVQSQRAEFESYQRVQALILMQDMAGRINANRKAAPCYAITTAANGTPYMGTDIDTSTTSPTCTIGTAAQKALAIQDLTEWNNLLLGAAEKTGGSNVGAMIGARGCVNYDATTNSYLITVTWQGNGETASPSTGLTCASGKYGSEKQRRAVSTRLQIAILS